MSRCDSHLLRMLAELDTVPPHVFYKIKKLSICMNACWRVMHAHRDTYTRTHARTHAPLCINAEWVYLIAKPAAVCSSKLALRSDHGSGTRCDMQMDIHVWLSALNLQWKHALDSACLCALLMQLSSENFPALLIL